MKFCSYVLAGAVMFFAAGSTVAQEPAKLPAVVKDKAIEAPVKATQAEAAPVAPVGRSMESALQKALVETYQNNPELEAQRRTQNAIDERVPQALSGALPTASIGYDEGRGRVAQGGNSAWSYTDIKNKNLSVVQPLFRGGSTWASVKAARNDVRAGQERLRQTEQEVLLATITSYMDVVRAQSVVGLSQKNLDVLSKQQEAARQRFNVGEDTRTDVAQSEARVAVARSQLTRSEGQLASALAAFKRTAGYELKDAVMPVFSHALPATLEEAIKEAEENNPRALEAKYAKESADYQINANAGRILPSVNLRGTMSRQEGAGVTGNLDFDQDQLLVAVSVPIFQGGAEYSRVREARETYQRQRFIELDTANRVRQQVVTAWEEWQAIKATLQSDQAAIDAAEIALDGVKQEQQYGARTTLDVLDAERELFDVRVQFVSSQRSEVVAAYTLLVALGRLTAQDLNLPVETYDANKHFEDVEYQFIGF